MKIKKIDHIAIAVKNLKDGTSIWKNMGFDVKYEEISEQKVRVALINVGDCRIEILEPIAKDSPISKFLEKRGEGLHHVAVEVDEIMSVMQHLKNKGYRLIDEIPRVGINGKKIAFVHPVSSKILLELVEE